MILLLESKISQQDLYALCQAHFNTMVKFVADISQKRLAVGGELAADAETLLLENGSAQSDLWGGNFFLWNPPDSRLEFTSFINIRPADDNSSMEICSNETRFKVMRLVEKFLLSPNENMEVIPL